jgi:hypothetical protein
MRMRSSKAQHRDYAQVGLGSLHSSCHRSDEKSARSTDRSNAHAHAARNSPSPPLIGVVGCRPPSGGRYPAARELGDGHSRARFGRMRRLVSGCTRVATTPASPPGGCNCGLLRSSWTASLSVARGAVTFGVARADLARSTSSPGSTRYWLVLVRAGRLRPDWSRGHVLDVGVGGRLQHRPPPCQYVVHRGCADDRVGG